MENEFTRTEMLLGSEKMNELRNKKVIVFGIGGVGGYVVEALVRSGIMQIDIVDMDTVSITNINRQIIATHKTVGMYKVDAMEERIKDINPAVIVNKHNVFFLPETSSMFDFKEYDYVIDAIDNVTGKIELVMKANEVGVPIISSMGAGNKLDPCKFKVADIYKTSICPLAKVMRKELKSRGVKKLKVVYSEELAIKPNIPLVSEDNMDSTKENVRRKAVPGSIAFIPSVVGLIIASEVIKDLIK